MPTIGPPELLVILLAATLVFLAFRGRVPPLALVLILVVLTSPVAVSLAFIVGAVANAIAPAYRLPAPYNPENEGMPGTPSAARTARTIARCMTRAPHTPTMSVAASSPPAEAAKTMSPSTVV